MILSLQGSHCFDVDGNKYIDYIGSWGPAIVGAANDEVNAALHTQIDKGTSFGAPCELEVRALVWIVAVVRLQRRALPWVPRTWEVQITEGQRSCFADQ